MLTPDEFRSRIEDFLATSGMTPTAFGIAVLGDRSFVPSLRNGRVVSLTTAAKVLDFIRDHAKQPAPEQTGAAA